MPFGSGDYDEYGSGLKDGSRIELEEVRRLLRDGYGRTESWEDAMDYIEKRLKELS